MIRDFGTVATKIGVLETLIDFFLFFFFIFIFFFLLLGDC